MHVKISFEGEINDDREEILMLAHVTDMYSAIFDAKNEIRSRLKYGEGISDEEEKTLEAIREHLYIGGLDI